MCTTGSSTTTSAADVTTKGSIMTMKFSKNIGTLDQVLRLGISGMMIYFGFIDTQLIADTFSAHVVGILGVLNGIVAVARFCPLYAVAGITTCRAD